MGRRSITGEAETEQSTDDEDEEPQSRTKHTQRMPDDLSDDIEEWAKERGMSKNAAINFAVRELLD